METRAHYVVIGSAVMITVAAAFLFIIWKAQAQREFDEYDVIFTERVSGLSKGAAVRFNGIQKGEVETLSIDPVNPSIVIARVRVDKDTPVKIDTRAELELVGFTGLAIIQFVGGSADAPLLKEASNKRIPEIKASFSGFGQFLEGSGDVIAQANRLLSDKNIENLTSIIDNIKTITGAVAANEKQISATLQNVETISADLAKTTGKLDTAMTSLQALLDEDAPETLDEAQAFLAEAKALTSEVREVVSENRASLRIFADQGLAQVAPAVADARRLMRTLDDMLREFDRDPKAYLLGDNAPEYCAEEKQ